MLKQNDVGMKVLKILGHFTNYGTEKKFTWDLGWKDRKKNFLFGLDSARIGKVGAGKVRKVIKPAG